MGCRKPSSCWLFARWSAKTVRPAGDDRKNAEGGVINDAEGVLDGDCVSNLALSSSCLPKCGTQSRYYPWYVHIRRNYTVTYVLQALASQKLCQHTPSRCPHLRTTHTCPVEYSISSVPPALAFRIHSHRILPVTGICFDRTNLAIVEFACWIMSPVSQSPSKTRFFLGGTGQLSGPRQIQSRALVCLFLSRLSYVGAKHNRGA